MNNALPIIIITPRHKHTQATINPRDNVASYNRILPTITTFVISAFMTTSDNTHNRHLAMEPLYPTDLEERTLARFDELARKGKIFYEEAVSELIIVDGFDVSRA
jgi:hypothetical protein